MKTFDQWVPEAEPKGIHEEYSILRILQCAEACAKGLGDKAKGIQFVYLNY